jgi:phenylacetate-CoA ligase
MNLSGLAAWFSRSIGYPLVVNGGWRRGKDRRLFARLVREKLESQFWPAERVEAWQLEHLRPLLEHAGRQVPYYRDLFRQVGFDPRGLRRLADLGALPTLTRSTLKTEGPRMLAEDAPATVIHKSWTGGTTGVPMEFWRDRRFDLHFEAGAWMSDMVAGRRFGSRTVYMWGAARDINPYKGFHGKARTLLRNESMIDTHFVSDDDLDRHHRFLERRPPDVLVAYASTINLLAAYLERRGLRPRYPRISLISTAEALEPDVRARLERVFTAPLFDRYGSREVGLIAYECEQHQGLHLNMSDLHLEIIGADASEPGEVVITTFHNYAMPLIRYELGDLALLANEACGCGRTAPRLRRVTGRKMQHFINAAGQSVEAYGLVLEARRSPHLREFQLIQEDARHLRLLVAPLPSCTPEHLAWLRTEVLRQMGAECDLVIDQVSQIPVPMSGKRQQLVSKIPAAR